MQCSSKMLQNYSRPNTLYQSYIDFSIDVQTDLVHTYFPKLPITTLLFVFCGRGRKLKI